MHLTHVSQATIEVQTLLLYQLLQDAVCICVILQILSAVARPIWKSLKTAIFWIVLHVHLDFNVMLMSRL